MSESNERPPSPIPVPWPFRPPYALEPSHPLYNHVARDHEQQAAVQARWDAEWDEFDRYYHQLDQDILELSGLVTIPLLHPCLHNATINASKINIHMILPRARAAALAEVVNDGGILVATMCEMVRTVNGQRLGSLRYIQ